MKTHLFIWKTENFGWILSLYFPAWTKSWLFVRMVQFCRFVSILKKFGGLYKHHAIPNQDWNRKIMNHSNVGINQTKEKNLHPPKWNRTESAPSHFRFYFYIQHRNAISEHRIEWTQPQPVRLLILTWFIVYSPHRKQACARNEGVKKMLAGKEIVKSEVSNEQSFHRCSCRCQTELSSIHNQSNQASTSCNATPSKTFLSDR